MALALARPGAHRHHRTAQPSKFRVCLYRVEFSHSLVCGLVSSSWWCRSTRPSLRRRENDPTGCTTWGVWTDPTDGYPKVMLIMVWRKHLPIQVRSRNPGSAFMLPKYNSPIARPPSPHRSESLVRCRPAKMLQMMGVFSEVRGSNAMLLQSVDPRMGRWVVIGVVAATLLYDHTRSFSTMANVAPASYPSTTGAVPASHKLSPRKKSGWRSHSITHRTFQTRQRASYERFGMVPRALIRSRRSPDASRPRAPKGAARPMLSAVIP
jgi:hypothetical protein